MTMTGTLKVTGKTTAGSTLTASKGSLTDTLGVNNITYIWSYDGNTDKPIGVGSTYKLTSADIGERVTVTAVYKTTLGANASSDNLFVLNHNHTGGVSVKGTTSVGSTLSAVSTLKDVDGIDPNNISYQWFYTDSNGNPVDIGNANSSTYKLTSFDVGDKMGVRVSYIDNAGYEELAVSKVTSAVIQSTKTSSFNDILTATAESDKLTGGLGADKFIFTTSSPNLDIITDFNHSQGDTIDLSKIDAFTSTSTDDPFQWLGNAAPTGIQTNGVVWFDANTNTLYGSNDTDVAPEFSIQLTGVTVLEQSDISF